jgi:hypothetical protein
MFCAHVPDTCPLVLLLLLLLLVQVLFSVTQNTRPDLPPDEELPGRPCVEALAPYKDLMTRCWDQDPGARPGFEAIVVALDDMRAKEAARRAEAGSRWVCGCVVCGFRHGVWGVTVEWRLLGLCYSAQLVDVACMCQGRQAYVGPLQGWQDRWGLRCVQQADVWDMNVSGWSSVEWLRGLPQ